MLTSIDGLTPFNKKDEEGNPIKPTVSDAYSEKRKLPKFPVFLCQFNISAGWQVICNVQLQ